jgi:hypothetical protein
MAGLPLYPEGGIRSGKIPPFPFANTKSREEIDLREEMNLILEGNEYWPRRGHWVVLRRMDKRQRCFCWNKRGHDGEKYSKDNRKYMEATLRCPVCRGEGWVYEEDLYLSRRRLVSPEVGLANSETLSPIGWMNINYIVYYFQYYVNPNKDDKIFEVQLDSSGDPVRPFIYLEQYNIAVAEPFRDQQGRIEFWRAASKIEVV